MTTTRSPCMMVSSRWAMVSTVASVISRRSVCWISSSVSMSTDAVASSRTSTREPRSSARAVQTSCRCPADRLAPFGSIGCSRPAGCAPQSASSEHWARHSRTSASACCPKGSRLLRSEPLKRVASCGMIASACRSARSGTVAMSTPSIEMEPSASSTSRKSAASRLLLPAPVRPTKPTFSPPPTRSSKPRSTKGVPGRYRMPTDEKTTSPRAGHSAGGGLPAAAPPGSRSRGSSGSRAAYESSRSTLTICISRVVDMRSAQLRKSVSETAYERESPASPAAMAAPPPPDACAAACSPTARAATPAMMALPMASSRTESHRFAAAVAKPTLMFASSRCRASSPKRRVAPKATMEVAPCRASEKAA
mmetsp:Transcript_13976/g.41366  ORF Transcript_13976/g.41366 Transcript_13976/m.41366 type:complete len:365 (-) Transcript_13976:46-1140(-)